MFAVRVARGNETDGINDNCSILNVDRQADGHADRQTDVVRHGDRQPNGHIDRQMDERTVRRHIGRQTDGRDDSQTAI